ATEPTGTYSRRSWQGHMQAASPARTAPALATDPAFLTEPAHPTGSAHATDPARAMDPRTERRDEHRGRWEGVSGGAGEELARASARARRRPAVLLLASGDGQRRRV